MIKLAFNKENPNLVFEIDSIDRVAVGDAGIEEKYLGTLIDTSTVPDTHKENYRVQVAGFEMKWTEVPIDLGSTGDINNQDKTVTPTTSQQTVKPDSGYTGLNSVKVKAAPLETASVTPTALEQTITPTGEGKIGLSSVTVAATPLEVCNPTLYNYNGATGSRQYHPSPGKVGFKVVNVPYVTAAIDANITAGNIKKDVTILGVTGNYEGSSSGTLSQMLTARINELTVLDNCPRIDLQNATGNGAGDFQYLHNFLSTNNNGNFNAIVYLRNGRNIPDGYYFIWPAYGTNPVTYGIYSLDGEEVGGYWYGTFTYNTSDNEITNDTRLGV